METANCFLYISTTPVRARVGDQQQFFSVPIHILNQENHPAVLQLHLANWIWAAFSI